jgi:DNA anti-recombination protein RmuC
MVKGKWKNLIKNQGYLVLSEHSSPIKSSHGYRNTLEKQDLDLKSHLMMLIEDFKKDINNSLIETQKNIGKQVEAPTEETGNFLNELQKRTINQVKELNKTIQDLKMEVETIKKLPRETTLQIENLGKR